MASDYKTLRKANPNAVRQVRTGAFINRGLWVPVSVAAYFLGVSKQAVRLKIYEGKIAACQYPVGPVLVDLHSYRSI